MEATEAKEKPFYYPETKGPNYITSAIHREMQLPMQKLLLRYPEMKDTSEVEFNSFVGHIHNNYHKIRDYALNGTPDNKLQLKAVTGNFVFYLLINPDLTSVCKVELISRVSKSLPPLLFKSRLTAKEGYVYFLKSDYGYKIGCTQKISQRMKVFDVKLPFKVELHSYVRTKFYKEVEKELHKLMAAVRIDGEWFNLSEKDFEDLDKYLGNRYCVRMPYNGENLMKF